MMLLPTGKEHLSFSELKGWSECSYRHFLQHVKKIDMFVPNVNVAFGTATHNVVEHFVQHREIKLELARSYLVKYLEENGSHPKFVPFDVEKEMKRIESIAGDFPAFMDVAFPEWEVVSVEEQLMESVHPHVDHEGISFKGFIDTIISVPEKKKKLVWILDFKTTSRYWSREKIEESQLQLVLYKKFWAEKHKVDLKDIRCGFLTLEKNAKPGKICRLIPVSVGDVTANRSLTVIDNFLGSVKSGIAVKNRSACRFCDFRGTEHCP